MYIPNHIEIKEKITGIFWLQIEFAFSNRTLQISSKHLRQPFCIIGSLREIHSKFTMKIYLLHWALFANIVQWEDPNIIELSSLTLRCSDHESCSNSDIIIPVICFLEVSVLIFTMIVTFNLPPILFASSRIFRLQKTC